MAERDIITMSQKELKRLHGSNLLVLGGCLGCLGLLGDVYWSVREAVLNL